MKAYRLSNFQLLPLYITLRSICALIGGIVVPSAFILLYLGYLSSMIFIISEAVIMAFSAIFLGFIIKTFYVLKTRLHAPVQAQTTYEIDVDGDVIYNPESVLADLKRKNYTPERWGELASKYQGKKYNGPGWNAVRVYCLTQKQKKNTFEIIDNRY